MRKIEIIEAPMTFNNGNLKLNESQAASRIHNLDEVKDGVYAVTGPVQFKIGEVVEYDGELPRQYNTEKKAVKKKAVKKKAVKNAND